MMRGFYRSASPRPTAAMSQVDELKSSGLKATLPRIKILEIFQKGAVRHMTAEDVYKALLHEDADIGLATTGVGRRNGGIAAKAAVGPSEVSRTRRVSTSSATAQFTSTSGSRSMKIVGPPIRNSGAAIHDCTPRM